MRPLRLSRWTTFPILLFFALIHSLIIQAELQTDTKAMGLRVPLQLSSNHPPRKFKSQIFARMDNIVEGYRLALSNDVQLLPISIAASELRAFWAGVMYVVMQKSETNDGSLLVSFGNMQVWFRSENPNVALDWVALLSFATSMQNRVCVGGGWAGIFQGTMTNLATQAVIRVSLHLLGA